MAVKAQWSCYFSYALFFILANVLLANSTGNWWAVGITGCGKTSPTVNDTCPNCAKLGEINVFDSLQEIQCQEQPALLSSLSKGARAAIIDCQTRFSESRWNCSTLYGEHLFGAFIANNHTRETGVLNAYFIAGAISAIADDCHNQRISDCPCITENARREIPDPDGGDTTIVIFESCKADYDFSANFIDGFVQVGTDFAGKIDQHNIDLGKEIVHHENTTCHCHGVSGTCTVQTCYVRIPTVAEVGEQLAQDYSGAVQVMADTDGEIINTNPNSDPPGDDSIVFTDPSPDFCEEDLVKGVVGVANRRCDLNSNNANACSTICCDHGHYPRSRVVPQERCEFVWCCTIICTQLPNVTVTEHFCNP